MGLYHLLFVCDQRATEQAIENIKQLSNTVPKLVTSLNQLHLLKTPSAPLETIEREQYINKAVSARLSKLTNDLSLGSSVVLKGGQVEGVDKIKEEIEGIGTTRDAQVSLHSRFEVYSNQRVYRRLS